MIVTMNFGAHAVCRCVCMYVCVGHGYKCQLEVMLGMSICAHAWAGYWICALHNNVGTTFLGDGGWEGQRGWPFTMYVFCGAKCINEC